MKNKTKMIITLLLPVLAFAGSFHGMFLLDMPVQTNASAAAMGGLTVLPAKDAANVVFAPFMLPDHYGFFASMQSELYQRTERREMPLYNTFDDVIYMSAYANNKNTFFTPSVFAGYRHELGDIAPAIAFGYAPIYDMNYSYDNMIGSESGRIEGNHVIESSGMLAGPAFALSVAHEKWGGIGFGMAMASTTAEYWRTSHRSVQPNSWQSMLYADSAETDLSATIISVQAVVKPTHRFEIGFRYIPTITVDAEYNELHAHSSVMEDMVYTEILPSRLGLAVSYKPSGHVPSRLVFEAEQFAWSELADESDAFINFDDTWSFRFGIEHKLPPGKVLRGGAYHYTIPVSSSHPVGKTGLTVGTSFKAWVADVNFALGFETAKYNTNPIFDVPRITPEDAVAYDTVRDKRLFGNIGFSVEF